MTSRFHNIGIGVDEEDFCHWTEKDVEFKCFEGLNAKLKKFYSWNKAIIVKIEIDGTIFCGCLYQDNNSFGPVKFGPPKRPPLPCIIPSKPKTPKRKKSTKSSSTNAYSRENWPRVYIDPHNTIEQRLRFGRDKNISNNRPAGLSGIDEVNSQAVSKKVDILVQNKQEKSFSSGQKSKNSLEIYSRFQPPERFYNSEKNLETEDSEAKSNNEPSAIEFGHANPKGDKNEVRCEGKECDELIKTSVSYNYNLRLQKANHGNFLNSDCGSNEILSSQYPLIDLTVSPTESGDEIQLPVDINDKSIAIKESSVQQISQHPVINLKNKNGSKIFVSDVLSPTVNVDKASRSANNAKAEVNDVLKSKNKKRKRKRKAFENESSDLSDKFERMTIRAATFGQPLMQSSPKRELDFEDVREEEHLKISGTEMKDPNSSTADSKPTNRSEFFFEKWFFIKEDQKASSDFQTKELRSGKKYQTT